MFELHPVTLADKAWVDSMVFAENSRSADYNFGNIFLWDQAFHQRIGRCGQRMVTLLSYDHLPFFAWPIGTGDPRPVLTEMGQYAFQHGFPFVLRGVTADHLSLVEQVIGPRAVVTPERAVWDYLYLAEKLETLSGKHLHAKRNHIHRFEENHSWRFTPLTADDIPACADCLETWMADRGEKEDTESETVQEEYQALKKAFSFWRDLSLVGGILWENNTAIAFTMGEMISSDTFDVHFEKAQVDIDGAYPLINREFVRYLRTLFPGLVWINREDDTGRESLRQSKLSYHPDRMVEKYKVELSNG